MELRIDTSKGPNDGLASWYVSTANGTGIAPRRELLADLGEDYVENVPFLEGGGPEAPAKKSKSAIELFLHKRQEAEEPTVLAEAEDKAAVEDKDALAAVKKPKKDGEQETGNRKKPEAGDGKPKPEEEPGSLKIYEEKNIRVTLGADDVFRIVATTEGSNKKLPPKTVLYEIVGGKAGPTTDPASLIMPFAFKDKKDLVVEQRIVGKETVRSVKTLEDFAKHGNVTSLFNHHPLEAAGKLSKLQVKSETVGFHLPFDSSAEALALPRRLRTGVQRTPILKLAWVFEVSSGKGVPAGVAGITLKQHLATPEVAAFPAADSQCAERP